MFSLDLYVEGNPVIFAPLLLPVEIYSLHPVLAGVPQLTTRFVGDQLT